MFNVDLETKMADGSDFDSITEEIDEVLNQVLGYSDNNIMYSLL